MDRRSLRATPTKVAELKEIYDKQLRAYIAACKKLLVVSKSNRQSGVPSNLPTLKKLRWMHDSFWQAGT